jgi:hypothetical protein
VSVGGAVSVRAVPSRGVRGFRRTACVVLVAPRAWISSHRVRGFRRTACVVFVAPRAATTIRADSPRMIDTVASDFGRTETRFADRTVPRVAVESRPGDVGGIVGITAGLTGMA